MPDKKQKQYIDAIVDDFSTKNIGIDTVRGVSKLKTLMYDLWDTAQAERTPSVLKVGDCVVLRGSFYGRTMVVDELNVSGTNVQCSWMDGEHHLQRHTFAPATLDKVETNTEHGRSK